MVCCGKWNGAVDRSICRCKHCLRECVRSQRSDKLRRRNWHNDSSCGTLAEPFVGDRIESSVPKETPTSPESKLVLLKRGFEADRVEEVARIENRVPQILPCRRVETIGA